ncbi:hypothetical protein GCM10009696_20170 [Kocuria himachalensis]
MVPAAKAAVVTAQVIRLMGLSHPVEKRDPLRDWCWPLARSPERPLGSVYGSTSPK